MSQLPTPTANLLEFLSTNLSGISSICAVGSSTRSYVEAPADLDFLLIVERNIPEDTILSLLSQWVLETQVSMGDWYSYHDTLRAEQDGLTVSLAFRTRKDFDKEVNNVFCAKDLAVRYEPWVIGGYVPEVLLGDIVDSRIVFERQEYLLQWKRTLRTYPTDLKNELLVTTRAELILRLAFLERASAAFDLLMFECVKFSMMLPLIRGVFARRGVYFRGMKHLSSQILHYVPSAWEDISAVRRVTPEDVRAGSKDFFRAVERLSDIQPVL